MVEISMLAIITKELTQTAKEKTDTFKVTGVVSKH